jgi:hypothetical protein
VPTLPVTFHPSRWSTLRYLAGSLAFVAVGVFLSRSSPWVAISCGVFFGLCSLIFLAMLHPRASFLTLSEEGFEWAGLFRTHRIAWPEVGELRAIFVAGQDMIGWTWSAHYSGSRRMSRANMALAGIEASLPGTYGHRPQELADLMNQIRLRYGKAA